VLPVSHRVAQILGRPLKHSEVLCVIQVCLRGYEVFNLCLVFDILLHVLIIAQGGVGVNPLFFARIFFGWCVLLWCCVNTVNQTPL
jgi:hypothetical protein